jgi:D-glycero-D-manno-heptose 1,7-bisphosphate phosphatase
MNSLFVNRSDFPKKAKHRAVFLDRDGVINRCEVRNGKPYAPRRLEDFRLLPGVKNAVRALKRANFLVIVVTNQPDIGNGLINGVIVEAMHQRLKERLQVDDIKVCPHRQSENCACRKPKPGMLLEAAKQWDINLRQSYMIGDRSSDIVAGQAVGCYTVFMDRGYREDMCAKAHVNIRSLPAAVRLILSRK